MHQEQGKTYATAEIAVSMIDKSVPNNRKDIMNRYKELVKEDRIFFTTFHQSMDYEEFVEGYKPITNNDGTMIYEPVDGIFKEACDKAIQLFNEQNLERRNYITIEEAIKLLNKEFLDQYDNLDEDKKIDMGSNRKLSCYNHDSGNIAYKVIYNEKDYEKDKTKGNYNVSTKQVINIYNNYNTIEKHKYLYTISIIKYMVDNLSDKEKKLMNLNELDKQPKLLDKKEVPVILIIDEINRGIISLKFLESLSLS